VYIPDSKPQELVWFKMEKKSAHFGEKPWPSLHLVLLVLEAVSAFSNLILLHHLHFMLMI